MRTAGVGAAHTTWNRTLLRAKRTADARRVRAAGAFDAADRLVPSPVFVLSSVRSGSTLLRMILDSHSQICAPHEMHLGSLRVNASTWFTEQALKQDGLKPVDLENLLWDRLLHLALARSGKRVIVDKTPTNLLAWRRIASAWPHARFVFLARHPARIAESLCRTRPDVDPGEHYAEVNDYAKAFADARSALPGITVHYEQLAARPADEMRHVCDYLDVEYEPAMLDYGAHRRPLRRGLGDWGERIGSGRVQPAPPDPSPGEVPDALREACRRLGY